MAGMCNDGDVAGSHHSSKHSVDTTALHYLLPTSTTLSIRAALVTSLLPVVVAGGTPVAVPVEYYYYYNYC
jgi:hypothetical protein